jgi:hypothetical protein
LPQRNQAYGRLVDLNIEGIDLVVFFYDTFGQIVVALYEGADRVLEGISTMAPILRICCFSCINSSSNVDIIQTSLLHNPLSAFLMGQ